MIGIVSRSRLFRRAVLILVTGCLLVAGAPLRFGGATAFAATNKDTVVLAYYGSPATIDPAIAYDYAGPPVVRGAYDRLVHMKGTSTSELEGDLATRWSSNAQKTVWTFWLRKGVTFHDGTPFNADAVKFSVQRVLAINSAPAYIYGQFMTAKDVEVVNPYEVRFHLNAPAPRFLYALASQYATWMVSPTAVKKHTVKNDWAQGWLGTHDAGTGPYMISQYTPAQSAVLVKFPGYWRGWSGPHVSRVIISFVDQDSTRREMLEKGSADISLSFTPEDMLAMAKNPDLVVDSNSIVANWTLIPTEYGPFASKDARLALQYAFDYNAFSNGLMKGFARPAQGPLTHYADGHDNSLPVYKTDLNKARQLFAAAGVKPGTTMTLEYNVADETLKDVALVAQGQLDQLGFKVVLEPRSAATYFNDGLFGTAPVAQRPNLWVGGWSGDYNDAIAWFLPLYNTKNQATGAGGANAGVYSNKEVDKLTAQAAVTVNPATRQRLVNRIQHILMVDDPAAVYVAEQTNSTTYRKELHGYYYNTIDILTYDFYAMWK